MLLLFKNKLPSSYCLISFLFIIAMLFKQCSSYTMIPLPHFLVTTHPTTPVDLGPHFSIRFVPGKTTKDPLLVFSPVVIRLPEQHSRQGTNLFLHTWPPTLPLGLWVPPLLVFLLFLLLILSDLSNWVPFAWFSASVKPVVRVFVSDLNPLLLYPHILL